MPLMRSSAPETCSPIRMKIRLFSMNTRMFHTERARMRISAETMAGEKRPRTRPAATTASTPEACTPSAST